MDPHFTWIQLCVLLAEEPVHSSVLTVSVERIGISLRSCAGVHEISVLTTVKCVLQNPPNISHLQLFF